MESRKLKLDKLNFATENIYDKKTLFTYVEIKHHSPVVKPVILYGTEAVGLPDLKMNLLKIERRILKTIEGPKITEQGYRLKSNNEKLENLENHNAKEKSNILRRYG